MTLPLRGFLSLLTLLFVPVPGLAKTGDANSTLCARCHEEGKTQPTTEMARALETAGDDAIFSEHPLLTATDGKYLYRIETKGEESLYSVSDGTDTITMPIRAAMGVGTALGQTYILEKDGKFFESRMSWFRALDGLAPTLGQQKPPADLNDAAGKLLSQDDTMRCFSCHATNAVENGRLTLDKMTAGVQCSHCHQATEMHLAALVKGSGEPIVSPALARLEHMSAEDASNFCGRCHRTWSDVVVHESYNIGDVRFQPYRLWSSLCYDPDDARISCLSCHDPHKEPSAKPVDYDAKCQACHGGGKAKAKICRVARRDCVSCHMPKTEIPGAHYKFTDHRIRVVKANERFQP